MSGGKIISLSIILLITLLIDIIFTFKSHIFIREFILFWIFFIAAVILLAGLNTRWGAPWFTVFFSVQILNFIYLYYNLVSRQPLLFVIALFFSAIGLLISTAAIKKSVKKVPKTEIVESFEPGKYVASKTGSVYHAPKCDWAKKIKKKSQVWFNSESEAKDKGLKKHSCVK